MASRIPDNHPLRRLFRQVAGWAFEQGEFADPTARDVGVQFYISEDILARFVHVDNLCRLRGARGRPLADVAEMLIEGDLSCHRQIRRGEPGLDRWRALLEIQRHIGDYTLFITGLFPESLERLRWANTPEGLMTRVGRLFVAFDKPSDYYQHEGKRAYQKAAEIGREVGEIRAPLFTKLSSYFPSYVAAMSLVRAYLEASSAFQEAKDILF